MSEVVAFHQDFVKRISGDEFFTGNLLHSLNEEPPVSVRFNPKKVKSDLSVSAQVTWCNDAVYLSERPSFTLDPLFHAGSYYPQEAGSMLIDFVVRNLDLPSNPKFLDLCGAPGGKSTLLLSFLDNKGLLVSNEVINSRARILKENCTKWGYSNSVVTNNDPSDFGKLPGFFDLILVDAPCSGEGMFRKDQNSRSEWSEENVNLCSARQKRILADVWESLTPGGYLLYSTCTFNSQENEENVLWMEREFGAIQTKVSMPESITQGRDGVGHYAIPGISETEGFFIAILRKPEDAETTSLKKVRAKNISKLKDLSELNDFANLSEVDVFNWNEYLLAFPSEMSDDFLRLYSELRIVKLGTEIGTMARKGLVPSQDLAMNFSLRMTDRTISLDRNDALHYLKGESFTVDGNKGFQLVAFNQEPLGWIKNLGTRFNNLYPKEWRIKMNIN